MLSCVIGLMWPLLELVTLAMAVDTSGMGQLSPKEGYCYDVFINHCGYDAVPATQQEEQTKFIACCATKGADQSSCDSIMGTVREDWDGSNEDACKEAIELFMKETETSQEDMDKDSAAHGTMKVQGGGLMQVRGGKRMMGTRRSANPPDRATKACERMFVGTCEQSSVPPSIPAMKSKFMSCCKTKKLDAVNSCETMLDMIASRLDLENYHGSKDEACQQGIDLLESTSDPGPTVSDTDLDDDGPATGAPATDDPATKAAATHDPLDDPATGDPSTDDDPATDDPATDDQAHPSTNTKKNSRNALAEIGTTGIIRRNQRR